MDQQIALRMIAEKAYDVGYSAKLHFSTYDIVEKAPGWIGMISLIIGVLSLYIDVLAAKHVSALITVVGICSLYITYYSETKGQYFQAGTTLTELFDRLKLLHAQCESATGFTPAHQHELDLITDTFRKKCLTKHILFSGWLAHKKFFWDQQVGWIDEYRKFSLLRDKIPFSFYAVIAAISIAIIATLCLSSCHEFVVALQRICTHE
ncbi:SLATT domain-containing protein [Pseudomonas gingeri]|uniref:SLATT domain-containing protein n=1 Tax=Pseudomonas gingeri TaxID=117681 RepID=UPI0015A45178|nr:SLATT domain-containing protein [Pseudomonas gingeri]NWA24470.1 SLATT domain-containing protein [Pseudomonas gingeri]NWD67077.1 SLATT domain-containing protein [Pseudomonas gingeri]NWD77456.1 SLATT domain-containing protein [Pseudomonas gingeri]